MVGQGHAVPVIGGIFQDKPMLEVDRTGGAQRRERVRLLVPLHRRAARTRSTSADRPIRGQTFSKPVAISRSNEVKAIQGCDIAIEADGDVFVTYRTFTKNQNFADGLAFGRSTDGGASFSKAKLIRNITPYFPRDGAATAVTASFLCATSSSSTACRSSPG